MVWTFKCMVLVTRPACRYQYRIKHSFWRIYWCVISGHFTHKLNKSAKHFYVQLVSKMSRVYTSINSFDSYNSNSLALCTQFKIFEKLPCTTLFEPFLAKRPRQLWNVTMKRVNVTDVISKRDVTSLFDCKNLLKIIRSYCHNILRELWCKLVTDFTCVWIFRDLWMCKLSLNFAFVQ
jgi:hypothetical protein